MECTWYTFFLIQHDQILAHFHPQHQLKEAMEFIHSQCSFHTRITILMLSHWCKCFVFPFVTICSSLNFKHLIKTLSELISTTDLKIQLISSFLPCPWIIIFFWERERTVQSLMFYKFWNLSCSLIWTGFTKLSSLCCRILGGTASASLTFQYSLKTSILLKI